MAEALLMIGKTAFLFLFTLFCFRLMGYRSLGDMEPLDYVVVLGIGEIMGSPLSGEASIIRPMVAIATLTALQIILSALYAKIPKVGKIMEGGPVPVIRNGKLLKKNLMLHRIDQAAVMEELRIKGLRDEKDVDVANLEPSGRFSVILKNEAAPLTPRFFGAKGTEYLVEHGEIKPEKWQELAIDEKTVLEFLRENGVKNWSEVETITYRDGKLYFERKEN